METEIEMLVPPPYHYHLLTKCTPDVVCQFLAQGQKPTRVLYALSLCHFGSLEIQQEIVNSIQIQGEQKKQMRSHASSFHEIHSVPGQVCLTSPFQF